MSVLAGRSLFTVLLALALVCAAGVVFEVERFVVEGLGDVVWWGRQRGRRQGVGCREGAGESFWYEGV